MDQPAKMAPEQPLCSVRSPEPRDFDKIAELAGQLGYACTMDQIQVRLSEMCDSNDCAIYVAELAVGEVAGWIGVYIFRSVEMDKLAEINGLVVGEDHRSLGIGRVLLDAAENWARRRGCAVVSVHSNAKRERAHGFYQRNGYVWYKTQQLFRKCL